MSIKLKWNSPNLSETGFTIYRSESTMDVESLPTPLATVASGQYNYTDETTVDGVGYYYRIAITSSGSDYISNEQFLFADDGMSVETGVWVSAVAIGNEYAFHCFDPTDTTRLTYEELFGNTSSFAITAISTTDGTTTPDTGTIGGTLEKFEAGCQFQLHATCCSGGSDSSATMLLEVLDQYSNVLFRLNLYTTDDYGVGAQYGDADSYTEAIIQSPSTVGVPRMVGNLSFFDDRVTFTDSVSVVTSPSLLTDYVDGFSFNVDLSTGHSFRFSNVRASSGASVALASMVCLKRLPNETAITLEAVVDNSEANLSWNELSGYVQDVIIYRSTASFDEDTLPTELDSVAGGVGAYVDTTVDSDGAYYYMVDVQSYGESNYLGPVYLSISEIDPTLLFLYDLESVDGSILLDTLGNYDATITGSPTVVEGIEGNAVYFNADATYADSGLDSELDNCHMIDGNSFATCGWIKRADNRTDDSTVVGRGGGTGSGSTFNIYIAGSEYYTTAEPNTLGLDVKGSYTESDVIVTDDEWHFFCTSWNGTDGIFRVDDKEFPVIVGTAALQEDRNFAIATESGGVNNADARPGYVTVDKVRAWNRAISATERKYYYQEFSRFGSFTLNKVIADETFALTWTEQTNVTSVDIYRSETEIDTNSLPTPLATVSGGVLTYIDSSMVSGAEYYYMIGVTTSTGYVSYSQNESGVSLFNIGDFESFGTLTWFDISDTSTLWQDVAGTIPVTSSGDPVRLIQDKSSNGNDASADAGFATYVTDGTTHWLQFDDTQYFTFAQTVSGTQDRTVGVVFKDDWTSIAGTEQSGIVLSLPNDEPVDNTTLGTDWAVCAETTGIWLRVQGNAGFTFTPNTSKVYNIMLEWGLSLGASAKSTNCYSSTNEVPYSSGSDQTIGTSYAGGRSTLGFSESQGNRTFSGSLYHVVVLDAVLTSAERTLLATLIDDIVGL